MVPVVRGDSSIKIKIKPPVTVASRGPPWLKPISLSVGLLLKLAVRSRPSAIRYYEQIGLIQAAGRTAGNQRRYGQRQFERLAFIRHSRELGFPLDAIRELLSLADDLDRSCKAVDHIAARQLRLVESRIARLQALKSELKRMLA
jgi:DNA-binding transcriptional MerR regulator